MNYIINEECSICFEKLNNDIAHLSCNHYFHYYCIGSWIQKTKSTNSNKINCPLCNQEFEITNIYLPKNIVKSSNCDKNDKNEKNKISYSENDQTSKIKCNIL